MSLLHHFLVCMKPSYLLKKTREMRKGQEHTNDEVHAELEHEVYSQWCFFAFEFLCIFLYIIFYTIWGMFLLLFNSSVCGTTNTLGFLLLISRMLLVLVIITEEGEEHVMEEPVLGCFTNGEMVSFSESRGCLQSLLL